ncbi:kinase domain protein [Hypoxylon trugodes]|uniref:kinase domain protein n=1 Tax=Hypoxylon trugodes TaxID=326681 RepID=UPI00219DB9B6|nr:kinase domain protein [Hypoxylon trugodes]KAI1382970.1 kinase domain protein [Hypoxylon trugodes]
MAALLRWARNAFRRAPLTPLRFPTTGFDVIDDSYVVEEEHFDKFQKGYFYPVKIGDVYASKYQVVGKLGFGSTSTVEHSHVALKVYARGTRHEDEFRMYERLSAGSRRVTTALDTFILPRPGGDHHCLVREPLWDSWGDIVLRNPANRFDDDLLKVNLKQLFLALDFLHTECKIVHTDIKADNIFLAIEDDGVLEAFTKAELETPTPRKIVGENTIYLSRYFDLPKRFGDVILSDFGSAISGDEKRNHDAQPNVYRSPEVMLKVDWSYPIDIWNVGVVIWDLYEGRHLFYGKDPERKDYTTRAHLAEVVSLLGPPPADLVQRGARSSEFFTSDGKWQAAIEVPQDASLEKSVQYLEGKEKQAFLEFARGMLQWRPEDRKTAVRRSLA